MWLSNFSVRRPVTIIMAVCIVLILGFVSFTNLSVDLYPDFNLPYALVMTNYEGAGPEEVENLVTRPLEETMATLSGVDQIFSESIPGTSMIFIAMNWGTDMDFATLKMREQIDFVTTFMPSDIDKPMVLQMDPSMMPILEIGVTGTDDLAFLRDLVENEIKDRLLRIDGVASIYTTGGLTREIHVLIDPARLNAYGISMDQVMGALRSENVNFSSGQVIDGNREFLVRTMGQYESIEDIGNVVLSLPRGGHIYLRDLGEIKDTHKEVNQITRVNGEPSIGVHIVKQSKTNTVQVANKVKAELAKIEQELPGTVKMNIGFDQSQFINESIARVVQNTLIGGLLAIVVLLLFLRNLRSTLVIATAIPISIISTFILIYFNNLTLNMMTLGGIALGIGMMVDSSIVILENIYRHGQQGYSKIEAAKEGAGEVSSAVIAATITTLAVFLPIVFVQGIAAELFRGLALTVSFALATALVVALTLIPMLASKLLVVNGNGKGNGNSKPTRQRSTPIKWASEGMGRFLDWLNDKYGALLAWSLGHRKTVVAVVVLALVGSLALIPKVGMSFLPSMDSGEISISVNLARGTVLEDTNAVAADVEEYLNSFVEVKSIFVSVAPPRDGMTGLGAAATERISIRAMLVDRDKRDRDSRIIADEIRKHLALIPGAEVSVRAVDASQDTGGGGVTPIQVKIKGSDLDVLQDLAEQVRSVVEQVPGTREVEIPSNEGDPEYRIYVDRARAAQYGLSVAQVAGTARAVLEGQVATRYRTGSSEIDVRVLYPDSYRESLKTLRDTYITSPTGMKVPLSMVAEIKSDRGPAKITREDQVRTYTVNSQLLGRDLGSVMKDIEEKVGAEVQIPRGYSIEYGGEMEEMVNAFSSLLLALALAIILVYMVMASQFESLMYPFVIMFTMPTTLIGVIVGLAVTGRELSVPTFIGVIMLAGIVVNNAIVLVDYINVLRRRGLERNEAILTAGPIRLRPILMTSLTTILALLPTALGIGVGAEVAAPMATAVVAGLLVSSIFTLVLIPVVYTLFDDLGNWTRRKIGWEDNQFKVDAGS
ncbi:efflux RND transporter permease subunit [Desulfitibacter alkalitolerans]|uniref:efflux RND transporter permease subunit n=1 Tax=Desulfitibacter alkalitolerans TaxID=264641 RepID=UPI0005569158|nr:efflux RND transporter permease subunit [Desulfitibacter alkalitolerans]